MAIVKKITIGVMPFSKMFRISSLGGKAVDAVLRLRSKTLPDDFFDEVAIDGEKKSFRLSKTGGSNALLILEDSIAFSKDYYDAEGPAYDYSKFLSEFKTVWGTLKTVLEVYDVRRIGIVGEYRYEVPGKCPSGWLREKFTTTSPLENRLTEKMILRFEEREMASDGKSPDPLKSDFINTIYTYYDSSTDAQHPEVGFVSTTLDVQRYFTPVLNGSVGDEIQKLNKHYVAAAGLLDGQLKSLGATNVKK